MTMRLLAIFLVLAASGCTTASLQDAAPVAAAQPGANAAAFSSPGTYPNLNVIPEPAAAQFTREQIDTEAERLRATRKGVAGQSPGRPVSSSPAELRRLGRTHADEAVRIIEGE